MIVMRELPEGVLDRFSLSTMALAWLAMESAACLAIVTAFLVSILLAAVAGVTGAEGAPRVVTAETRA